MKLVGKLVLLLVVLVMAVGIYSYFALTTNQPRNLGITYTEADRQSGRDKSQIAYEELSAPDGDGRIWYTQGKREVDTVFSSREITAIMNNKVGIYFPYQDVQLKFNADGTGEISGGLIKSRLPAYAQSFNAPQVAVDLAMKFLPDNPVFYLKGRATLVDNQVGLFEPLRFEIGRVPMPLNLILANQKGLVKEAYAMDINNLLDEIGQVEGKRGLIIDFINSRLSDIEGFYAQEARFEDDKLIYKGTLPEKEFTLR